MITSAAHCEAILRGYSKRADKDGDWIEVKFQLHPQDIPELLNNAPLRTRFMLALAEIGDDERPVEKPKSGDKPKRKFEDLPLSQQAALACKDLAFQTWLQVADEDSAKHLVWIGCGITSRAELDRHDEPAQRWILMYKKYQQATGRVTEMR